MLLVGLALASPVVAHAGPRLLGDDTFAVHPPGALAVDGGLAVALPAALPAGISTGGGAGVSRARGVVAWGARLAVTSATASSMTWTVTHTDVRLVATGAIRHTAGRGTIALRFGLGTIVVHEHRVRNQGMRAGLTGSELETSATRALPAAELAANVTLQVRGPWALELAGGPTAEIFDGRVRGGWIAQVGVAWRP